MDAKTVTKIVGVVIIAALLFTMGRMTAPVNICCETPEIEELPTGVKYEIMNTTAMWVHGKWHTWIYSEGRDVTPVTLTRTEYTKMPIGTRFIKDEKGRVQIIK